MAAQWQWNENLFRGSARYYVKGRLPYPEGLASALAAALDLDGRGRLLDVGCGPGILALTFAPLFAEVVGLDPDPDMLSEAAGSAMESGIANVRWVRARAEELPAGLGTFRVATFGRSFHWMDQPRVAATLLKLLEPGGAFVQVRSGHRRRTDEPDAALPYPPPPREAIRVLVRRYLGSDGRPWNGRRRNDPEAEAAVLAAAGYVEPERIRVPGGDILTRTVDDVVADQFSHSTAAPHRFGDRAGAFEAELRALLTGSSPVGLFSERVPDGELSIWRTPAPAGERLARGVQDRTLP